jgi:hypothetical protein
VVQVVETAPAGVIAAVGAVLSTVTVTEAVDVQPPWVTVTVKVVVAIRFAFVVGPAIALLLNPLVGAVPGPHAKVAPVDGVDVAVSVTLGVKQVVVGAVGAIATTGPLITDTNLVTVAVQPATLVAVTV